MSGAPDTGRRGYDGNVTASAAPFLHVANGTSTTGTLEAAGIPGLKSIWADPLHDGPVPAGVNDEELLQVRERYLGPPSDDAAGGLRQWREAIANHSAYDELVLWYEHDLFDQLNLIQLLAWIRSRVPPTKTVSLICIDSFPGHPDFHGLGELQPGELASLFPTRRRVTDAEYALADRAWHAFRQPTPEAIDDLRQSETSALPFLAAALTRFLQEYPWTSDGLSRSERRLLQLAADGPIALTRAFPRMHAGEDAYYVADGTLAELAETLATTSPALLTSENGTNARHQLLHGTVGITDAGREVLAGRRDRVACGLDRWLGAVHLKSGAPIWRWDDDRQRMRSD